jgi:hypothetical protein
MSLSTFGGEINPHRNFDLCVHVELWNVCAKKNRLQAGELGLPWTPTHGSSC